MKKFLQQLVRAVSYIAAACVILLAIAVGLFRLLLPRLPEYQEEIKGWANAAIGFEVEFTGMNARWRLSGPELNFYNAELRLPGDDSGVFAAEEVSVGIELTRLITDQRLVVDRILVRDSAVAVRMDEDGAWRVQDITLDALRSRFAGRRNEGEVTLIAEEFDVTYTHPGGEQTLALTVQNLRVTRDAGMLTADALVGLPAELGNRLSLGASGNPLGDGDGTVWSLSLDSRDLALSGWSFLKPEAWPEVAGGIADVSVSLQLTAGTLTNAVATFDVDSLQATPDGPSFGAEARLQYRRDDAGWLLVADELRLRTERGIWPESEISVQAGTRSDGTLASLSAAASYLNLDDLGLVSAWVPEPAAEYVSRFAPSGRVTNLTANLSELQAERMRYDVAVELSDAGISATDGMPGVRGFSGSLRANRSGGRAEIDASIVTLDFPRWLAQPVQFDSAQGTVIWRRNAEGIIVLSDSIQVQNSDVTSRSSLQLSLPADGGSPVVDLDSRWSIYDLAAARRYLPEPVMSPALYRWLQNALQAGSIPVGTTRLSGALDRFPFDDGDGIFRIQARLEDARLRYSGQWPDAEIDSMDLVVDRTRLYSETNTASSAGNSVVDADIEIADLREPVLTIDAFSTGTLGSIRRFAQQSPIANVFGGHLDRVTVAGNASFTLQLNYPIRQRENFTFETRIQASNGTLRIDGLQPPVEELNGVVRISRDDIDAEELFGRFLGEPVTIDLRPASPDEGGYSIVAEVGGRVTADGLQQGFGFDAGDLLEGVADYRGNVWFPRASAATPGRLRVAVASTLEGIGVQLPSPVGKSREDVRAFTAEMTFPESGRIETRGRLADRLQWQLAFLSGEQGWDFDRGVLAVGDNEAGAAQTRGLHIRGATDTLRLREWLDVGGGGGTGSGIASRIRSIDLDVQNLFVLGQHFGPHRVQVDRSSNDWLVRLDGEQAIGSVTIPYNLASGRELVLDMQRLLLPGSDEDAEKTAIMTDPRTVPPVELDIEEFAFGERHLGSVQASFARTSAGLVAENVQTSDETFTLEGAAGWVVDTREPSGQRSWVRATLRSTDIAATMRRLDSEPGLDGDDMEIRFDVSWSGGPREDFIESLDGDVNVRLGTGRLDEVEPGAGRMFGLMSVVALPRRLALDFRDVLDKGFLFDEITGTFRVVDGSAFTCDLSLKGPAADIGIVGRAGLVEQDYRQTAIVSANVGNTLPVVGAVVAGPQVAAALLIFSQIFKKPLQEMGQVYYAIDGTWSEPEVESANAARFAETSRLAGCLTEGQ